MPISNLESERQLVNRSRLRGLGSQWLLISCLILLTLGLPAQEPEATYDQVLPSDLARAMRAEGTPRKPHGSNSQVNSQFEEPPQRTDMFLVQQLEQIAAQNRERARKRVMLPPGALAPLSGSGLGPSGNPDHETGPAVATSSPGDERFYQGFLFMLLLSAIGILAVRQIAPEYLESIGTLLRPWTLETPAVFERTPIEFADEKAFAEFQAKFRIGISGPGGTAENGRVGDGQAEADIFAAAGRHIEELRKLVQQARLGTEEMEQRKLLRRVYETIQPLKDLMAHTELMAGHQMTCALELLVKQLSEKAGSVTSSTLRTVTQGMELLAELCRPDLKSKFLSTAPLRLLVVDDETFSRYALSFALKRTLEAPDIAENGETALELATRQTYDLIFLDVQMPGMDGFELCSKIHETDRNRETPVLFITSLRDFDSRTKSLACGGRDVMSKPFLTFELTVKALSLIARERLHGRGRAVETAGTQVENAPLPAAIPEAVSSIPSSRGSKENESRASAGPELKPAAAGSQSKMATEFHLQARANANKLRELVDQIQVATNKDSQSELLADLYLRVHTLAVGAEACEWQSLSQISSAIEGLLKKLLQNTRNVTASTLQAVTTAVSLIQELSAGNPAHDHMINAPIRVLAVDDDPISRRFMTNALQLNFFLPQNAADGKTAIELVTTKPFDAIFLDVQMPEIDGFTVCKEIRRSTINHRTPVVFVTSHTDASIRDQGFACGGNDFISKPYVCSELTLRTITLALRNRLSDPGGSRANQLPVPDSVQAAIPSSQLIAQSCTEPCQ